MVRTVVEDIVNQCSPFVHLLLRAMYNIQCQSREPECNFSVVGRATQSRALRALCVFHNALNARPGEFATKHAMDNALRPQGAVTSNRTLKCDKLINF